MMVYGSVGGICTTVLQLLLQIYVSSGETNICDT